MTSVAYGIALPASRGILSSAKYCAEAEAFFARLSTQPSAARKLLYDALIRALVAAGVWSKLDALYMLAAADQATALTNLVQAAYGATATNSPTFTADSGFIGNGTSAFISTGFNPSTATSPQYTQNSASLGVWNLTNVNESKVDAGGTSGTSPVYLASRFSDLYFAALNSASDTDAGTASSDSRGLFALSRTASTDFARYKNGSSVASLSKTSAAVQNSTFRFLAGASSFSTKQQAAGFIGGGLTAQNMLDLYNAIHSYLQAVAGVA